jgi:hypothetical protein
MKKSLIMITTALLLALSAAGCGNQKADTSIPAATEAGESTDVSEAYERTEADMAKIEGKEATSDTAKGSYEGSVGDYEVSIEDAKMVEYDGENIVIVSFEYKNNSDKEMSFTGAFDVTVSQNDSKLPGEVIDDIEGLDLLAMSENVPIGGSITVQRAYRMRDDSAPVVVEVREFGSNGDPDLAKTFEF